MYNSPVKWLQGVVTKLVKHAGCLYVGTTCREKEQFEAILKDRIYSKMKSIIINEKSVVACVKCWPLTLSTAALNKNLKLLNKSSICGLLRARRNNRGIVCRFVMRHG